MDGATDQTVSLAEAMENAWTDCRNRLDALRGRLSDRIAEQADLAAALHRAAHVRRMLLEQRLPVRGTDGRRHP